MVGWWTTLIGNLYEHVTIWEYDDMAAFRKRSNTWAAMTSSKSLSLPARGMTRSINGCAITQRRKIPKRSSSGTMR